LVSLSGKAEDEHRLPITTDVVRPTTAADHINELHGLDYQYLFCHYQGQARLKLPKLPKSKGCEVPAKGFSRVNPMVKAIRHLIKQCDIKAATGCWQNSLELFYAHHGNPYFGWLYLELFAFGSSIAKQRLLNDTHARYRPGELLDVACVMALEGKFISYDSDPESLRQNPELHELNGLLMPSESPHGYCIFREFCPRFGRCYTCGATWPLLTNFFLQGSA